MAKIKGTILGRRFGRLVVLSEDECHSSVNKSKWLCKCDCGETKIVAGNNLKFGNTVSCGCYFLEKVTTHKLCRHPLYRVYDAMKSRCLNPNHLYFDYYGGRDIKICDRWLESFENFFEDMSSTYAIGLELDRKDTNGDYCKENCRWVTRQQNVMNTRSSKNSTSEYKGVCWVTAKKKWRAQITKDYKVKHIGYFINETEAALAYNAEAIVLFGEYAYLNTINGEN